MAAPSRVAATGMAATPAADTPLVRLQLASFRSRANADRFAAANQIGWNDCVLGKRLGVLPPGRDSLPERCTARVDVEVLVVEPARVHGRTFYRVMTRRFPASDLWGPVNAFRLAGIDPLVVK